MAKLPAMTSPALRIAVLLPCYNEEAAIAQTVAGFRAALPDADIYVYDNNSRDRTREVAAAAGAIVRTERMQGKGHVVRRMFADVEADVYVMADGDATYDAAAAPELVRKLLDEQLDMVVGARKSEVEEAYRRGHALGNKLFTGLLAEPVRPQLHRHLLGLPGLLAPLRQELPGCCRAASRPRPRSASTRSSSRCRSARSSPPTAPGPKARPRSSRPVATAGGSCRRILHLYRIERPVLFYGSFSLFLIALAVVLAIPLAITYFQTGLVPRFPTAILATGLIILAFLSFFAGLILDTVVRGRREVRRLHYLSFPAPGAGPL